MYRATVFVQLSWKNQQIFLAGFRQRTRPSKPTSGDGNVQYVGQGTMNAAANSKQAGDVTRVSREYDQGVLACDIRSSAA